MDIVTKPMQEFADNTSAIRCSVDGVHDDFYYLPPDPADLERIGKHGTIVRVRLTGENVISDFDDNKLWFRHFAQKRTQNFAQFNKSLFQDWDCHIHKIVSKFVGLPREDVKVGVQLSSGKVEAIERWDRPVCWSHLHISEAGLQLLEEFQREHNDFFYENENSPEHVQVYPCCAMQDGIEFSWLLKLPTSKPGGTPSRGIKAIDSLGHSGSFVDGVQIVQRNNQPDVLEWFCSSGFINFTGEIRPILSVDRTAITSWPNHIIGKLEKLINRVISITISKTKTHFEQEQYDNSDPTVLAAWDYLLSHFHPCKAEFLELLATDAEYSDVILGDIAALTNNRELTLREFILEDKLMLTRVAYDALGHTAKMLFLSKCAKASRVVLNDVGLRIEGSGFSMAIAKHKTRRHDHDEILIRCEEWSGPLAEYDIITDFWPAISPQLFDRLTETKENHIIDRNRMIVIHKFSNGISALGEQDPCLVHPAMGLYRLESNSPFKKKPQNRVGRFDQASNNHWLFEINGHFVDQNCPRYILYVYVSPRSLTAEEETTLPEIVKESPEYLIGVRNGWSLLFLGRKHTPAIICPGVVSREAIVKGISDNIWNKLEGEDHLFLDNKSLAKFR